MMSCVSKSETMPLLADGMTPRQLARRQSLIDAVLALVDEMGPESLQMRDVAERSGVALGTAYRYFASKDHLLAVAWADWHRRLTDRVQGELARARNRHTDNAADRVVSFIRREVRAFQRHPNFARLVVMVQTASDPFASEALTELGVHQDAAFDALMDTIPEEVARPARTAINSVLSVGLQAWTTGRRTIADVTADLDAVIRLVLSPALTEGPVTEGPATESPAPTAR
jgi:AcrR family transcriptional regulator